MEFYRMGHAALQVEDVERALRFYRDVLGYIPEWEGDADWANLKLGTDDLSLVRKKGAVHPPHLGLRTRSLEELNAAHKRLKQAGVRVESVELHRDGTSSFYFYDPDNNLLEALFDPRID